MKVNMQQWVQRVLLSDERLAFPLMASTITYNIFRTF
jgi:hypothetical protein